MIKLVNRRDETGRIVRDANGLPITDAVEMTDAEIAELEADRAAMVLQVRYTPLQFMELFTDAEQLAIVTATMSNAAVKLWYDKMLAAQEIVRTDERVVSGMAALVAYELITQSRADEIMGVTA